MQLSTQLEEPAKYVGGVSEAGSGAEFVAQLMLAVMYCPLETEQRAKSHVAHAHEIAQSLTKQGRNLRLPRLMKVLRILSRVDAPTTLVHIPFVGDTLVIPDINGSASILAASGFGVDSTVDLSCDIELVYVGLHLETHRILATLGALTQAWQPHEFSRLVTEIIDHCTYPEISSVPHLDRVQDYFKLAANLVDLGNPSMAKLALQKANRILYLYSKLQRMQDAENDRHGLHARLQSLLRLQSVLECLAAKTS